MWRSASTCSPRMITGWQASRSMTTDLALDALEMGIWTRECAGRDLFTAITPRFTLCRGIVCWSVLAGMVIVSSA